MNALQTFLAQNPVDKITKEIRLKGRLKDYPITIQALSGEKFTQYQQLCIDGSSPRKRKFNTKKFHELLVVNCTLNPNFKDPEFMKQCGCVDPAGVMYKTLLAGEITAIAEAIIELSGFDTNIEEEVDEIKN